MPLAVSDVVTWQEHVAAAGTPSGRDAATDAERIDLLRALEDLKSTAAALQADLAVELDASVRAQQAAEGVPARRRGRDVAAQIALARRESPHRGGILLGLATALRYELPHTAAALRAGRVSEFRAQLIAQETACLEPEHRALVDEATSGDAVASEGVGTRELLAGVRRHVIRLDPAAIVRRQRRAHHERRVSIRPAPDTMTFLTALLPVAQGIAVHTTLSRAAASAHAAGDERGTGQLMADALVELVTGQRAAAEVPLTVDVIISDASLLGGATEPAEVPDAGPIPAEIARELVAHALDTDTLAWVRRLYADPAGDLVAMTSRSRSVPATLADYLAIRDQGICRTPWCDAPVREADHITAHAHGGPTTATNTQGLCRACNHVKQAAGWRQRAAAPDPGGGRHTVETTTPTGHTYRSTAPPPPEPSRSRPGRLDVEIDRVLGAVERRVPLTC